MCCLGLGSRLSDLYRCEWTVVLKIQTYVHLLDWRTWLEERSSNALSVGINMFRGLSFSRTSIDHHIAGNEPFLLSLRWYFSFIGYLLPRTIIFFCSRFDDDVWRFSLRQENLCSRTGLINYFSCHWFLVEKRAGKSGGKAASHVFHLYFPQQHVMVRFNSWFVFS